MEIENTDYLKKYIINCGAKPSKKETEMIECVIKLFSEYIVAVNDDYIYNKTYLISFISDFIQAINNLKDKYDFLNNEIIAKLDSDVDWDNIEIIIDETWIYKMNDFQLMNSFNKNDVNSKYIKYDINYVGGHAFSVTNQIEYKKFESKEILVKDIGLFIERYREINK